MTFYITLRHVCAHVKHKHFMHRFSFGEHAMFYSIEAKKSNVNATCILQRMNTRSIFHGTPTHGDVSYVSCDPI